MLSANFPVSAPDLPHYLLYRAQEVWPSAVILNGVEQYGLRSRLKPSVGRIYMSELDIYWTNVLRTERPYVAYSIKDGLELTEWCCPVAFNHLCEILANFQ